jgi:Sec-independent protein translocase protein TatA
MQWLFRCPEMYVGWTVIILLGIVAVMLLFPKSKI